MASKICICFFLFFFIAAFSSITELRKQWAHKILSYTMGTKVYIFFLLLGMDGYPIQLSYFVRILPSGKISFRLDGKSPIT